MQSASIAPIRAPTPQAPSDLLAAGERLDQWIECQQFVGWDPHDWLNSPLLSPLAGRGRLRHALAVAAVQVGRRAPWNLRPLLRIPKVHNAKADGLFLASYSRKLALRGQVKATSFVSDTIRRLARSGTAQYGGIGWGYPFPWPNRAFFAMRGVPTCVNTSFVIHGLLDAHLLLGAEGALALAEAGGEFLASGLKRFQTTDELCFSYTPIDQRWVHNANVLAGAALARLARLCNRVEWLEVATAAAHYTLRRQRPDGSWRYGEGSRDGWSDNFHTAFVLRALADLESCADIPGIRPALERGYTSWTRDFFDPGGAPRYTRRNLYPIDVHCCAAAIITLLRYSTYDAYAADRAAEVTRWAITNLQQPDGWFAYQMHPLYTIRVPYMRWSQAWMQRALTDIAWHIAGRAQV